MLNDWKSIKVDEDEYGRKLETKNISENLTVTIILTENQRKKLVKVDFMDGRFTISRSFLNNYEGNVGLQSFIDSVDTEKNVKKYLGIK